MNENGLAILGIALRERTRDICHENTLTGQQASGECLPRSADLRLWLRFRVLEGRHGAEERRLALAERRLVGTNRVVGRVADIPTPFTLKPRLRTLRTFFDHRHVR